MGNAPDAVKRLVDLSACGHAQAGRFDQDRKVFLSGDYKEEQLRGAKTPHEPESIQRQIAATDKAIDALVCELFGLTGARIGIVEDGDN